MKIYCVSVLVSISACFCFTLTYGCHNFHHRKRRQIDSDRAIETEQTRTLRNYFSECMERKTSNSTSLMWDTILDITVLDSNWYFNTDTANCSDQLNRDSAACWKNRLNNYLSYNSPLLPSARECIDEYSEIFECNGTWTRYFDLDNPSGNGDYETLMGLRQAYPNQICPNPTAVDARVVGTNNHIPIAGLTVTADVVNGFSCVNREQTGDKRCLDFEARFCCPQVARAKRSPTKRVVKRQAGFATTSEENERYSSCISQAIDLPENRRSLSVESMIEFAENHLACDDGEGYDCILTVNTTLNDTEILLDTWPYVLEAITRSDSPIAPVVALCNEQVFSIREVVDRITTGGRGWSAWSPWGHCPARCGEHGERLRRRTCLGGPPRVAPCLGRIHQTEPCSPPGCGRWTTWGQWSVCRKRRQQPFRVRRRSCTGASPGSDGCIGLVRQTESCEGGSPDSHENLGPWTAVGSCLGSCGHLAGLQVRRRYCNTGVNGSPGCSAPFEETKACTSRLCGSWGPWITSSPCTVTCGTGSQTRYRVCVNGREGDEGCIGETSSTVQCSAGTCENVEEGAWSQWNSWEQCHAQCNQAATQYRRRFCTNSYPGSPQCPGSTTDARECTNTCGTWSNWTEFTECQGSCGTSTMSRSRTCEGGEVGQPNCYGNFFESQQCYTGISCRLST